MLSKAEMIGSCDLTNLISQINIDVSEKPMALNSRLKIFEGLSRRYRTSC